MTERWRKRLGDLDKQSPSEDLYERAKGGPQLPEEPISRPSTSTRVVTGVAAFLVFALAISIFAIPALRLKGDEQSGFGASGKQLPLWPAHTGDQVDAAQTNEDGVIGNGTFLRYPDGVARAFGANVMGWTGFKVVEIPPAVTAYTIPSVSSVSAGCAPGYHCPAETAAAYAPSGASGSSLSPTSPFRTFLLTKETCGGDHLCSEWLEYVIVFQPGREGPGGVWMVLRAEAEGVAIGTELVDGLTNGMSILAYGSLSSAGSILGYRAGYGSCETSGATTEFARLSTPGPGPSADGNGSDLVYGDSRAELAISLPARAECSGVQPGYIYAASFDQGVGASAPADPLLGGGMTVKQLTAMAVTFDWPGAAENQNASSSSGSSAAIELTTHTDPLGWTIDVPAAWVTVPIDGSDAQLTYQGAAFGSVRPQQYPGGPTSLGAPPDEVLLEIYNAKGGPADVSTDDSAFPLSFDNLDPEEGGLTGTFRGDGLLFHLVIRFADTTPEQQAILRRMVESIHFDPWELGETRNGWTAIGPVLPASSAEWIVDKLHGQHYVASFADPGRALFGPAPPCAGGSGSYEVRETGVAGVRCPDGTGGDWDFRTGKPQPGNTSGFDTTLASYPAVRSWDGMLLAQLSPTG